MVQVTVCIGFEYVLTLVKLTYVAMIKAVDQTDTDIKKQTYSTFL